jgi:hypothetical protein
LTSVRWCDVAIKLHKIFLSLGWSRFFHAFWVIIYGKIPQNVFTAYGQILYYFCVIFRLTKNIHIFHSYLNFIQFSYIFSKCVIALSIKCAHDPHCYTYLIPMYLLHTFVVNRGYKLLFCWRFILAEKVCWKNTIWAKNLKLMASKQLCS